MSETKQHSEKPRSLTLGTAAVVALLVAIICGILGVGTAVANVATHADNPGYLDAKLVETWGDKPDGNIYPGYSTTRTAKATNVGSEACYVRLKLDKYWGDENTLERDDPEKYDANLIEVGMDDTEKWQLNDDGWYYYVDPVEPGAETTSLLKDVKFTEEIGEEFNNGVSTESLAPEVKDGEALDSIYLTEAAIIDVELQAVVAHNPVDEGGDLEGLRASFIPKTGDTLSPLVLTLFALALIAFATCIALFIASKRKKNEEDAEDADLNNTPQQTMRC